jgi:hypothetical protein
MPQAGVPEQHAQRYCRTTHWLGNAGGTPQRHSREGGNPCQLNTSVFHIHTMGPHLRGDDAEPHFPAAH